MVVNILERANGSRLRIRGNHCLAKERKNLKNFQIQPHICRKITWREHELQHATVYYMQFSLDATDDV